MPITEEKSITDVLLQLQDYNPTIPDAITSAVCSEAGFETNDPRIIRLLSIASQKFISDIANDVMKHCRKRLSAKHNSSGCSFKDRKVSLSMEDLTPVLKDYGIVVRNPPYFI